MPECMASVPEWPLKAEERFCRQEEERAERLFQPEKYDKRGVALFVIFFMFFYDRTEEEKRFFRSI